MYLLDHLHTVRYFELTTSSPLPRGNADRAEKNMVFNDVWLQHPNSQITICQHSTIPDLVYLPWAFVSYRVRQSLSILTNKGHLFGDTTSQSDFSHLLYRGSPRDQKPFWFATVFPYYIQ